MSVHCTAMHSCCCHKHTWFWARTCITGGVVPAVCVTDTSLSSSTCGGVVDDDVGEWEPES